MEEELTDNTPPLPGFDMLDLRAHQCRFAITPHDQRHHRFCGEPTQPEKMYCEKHDKLVRVVPRFRYPVRGPS